MASPLAPTYGIWMVAQYFISILLGMGLLQVYLYFHWYSTVDHWGIKSTVILITVLEVLQSSLFFSATYSLLIDGFGSFEGLGTIPWQAPTQLLLLYMSTFVAQLYFAYCIFILHKRRLLIPLAIAFISTVAFGAGIAQFVLTLHKIKFFKDLPSTSWATNTQAALSLTSDIMITAGLSWRVSGSKTGIQSSNTTLNFVIMTLINRGVLTMATALLNMVLFLTKPGTFYFIFVLLISGKFYMNSMLAMLNTRAHIGNTEPTTDHIASLAHKESSNNQAASVEKDPEVAS